MNADERLEIVEELLRTTQVVRKNMIGNEVRNMFDRVAEEHGTVMTDERAEAFLSKMFPVVFGPKSIMPFLIRMTTRKEPPSGQDLYNLLYMVHYLDETQTLKTSYNLYNRFEQDLPEPTISMILED